MGQHLEQEMHKVTVANDTNDIVDGVAGAVIIYFFYNVLSCELSESGSFFKAIVSLEL